MTVEELNGRIESGRAPVVLDVRSSFEFESGHISGSVHAPLMKLVKTAAAFSEAKEDLLLLTCEHGPRAQLARMILRWSGYRNVELLDGHMARWRSSGCPVKKGH